MLQIILCSLVIMLASLGGVIAIWKNVGRIIEKNLHFLVSFSAGVFLFISYSLGFEVIEHAEKISSALIWILVGAIGVWLVFKILPSFHHHHDHDTDTHTHSSLDARKILLSDALHNIGDGILLASSFAVSTTLGLITTLSVFIHEIIQETSQFFVLKEAGYSTKKALSMNLIVSSSILIGSLGGFFLLESFEAIEVPLLGIATGSFLIVVIQDLIPHSVRQASKSHVFRHIAWFLAGVILMAVVGAFTPGH